MAIFNKRTPVELGTSLFCLSREGGGGGEGDIAKAGFELKNLLIWIYVHNHCAAVSCHVRSCCYSWQKFFPMKIREGQCNLKATRLILHNELNQLWTVDRYWQFSAQAQWQAWKQAKFQPLFHILSIQNGVKRARFHFIFLSLFFSLALFFFFWGGGLFFTWTTSRTTFKHMLNPNFNTSFSFASDRQKWHGNA